MKQLLVLFTAFAFVWNAHAEPVANKIASKQLAMGVTLLRDHQKGANTVISPFSIHAALMLARLGARGQTAQELDAALLPSSYSPQILTDYAALNRSVVASQESTTVSLANSLWLTDKGTFQPQYLRDSVEVFVAEPHSIDFTASESARKTINSWVSSKTNSLIPNLLPFGSISPETVSTLVNALYFKAAWLEAFTKESTKRESFWVSPDVTANVPTMFQSHSMGYFENESWQAVHLPYHGNKYYFLLLLSKNKLSTSEILDRITPALISDAEKEQEFTKVNLRLPRFTIRESQNMTQKLAALGLTTALSPRADFTGIASIPTIISKVQHESVVIVDENGTEAAAATAIVMDGGAFMPNPPQPKELRADHPFLFALIHRESGAPLFLGVVGDPR
jgi:serpin B